MCISVMGEHFHKVSSVASAIGFRRELLVQFVFLEGLATAVSVADKSKMLNPKGRVVALLVQVATIGFSEDDCWPQRQRNSTH